MTSWLCLAWREEGLGAKAGRRRRRKKEGKRHCDDQSLRRRRRAAHGLAWPGLACRVYDGWAPRRQCFPGSLSNTHTTRADRPQGLCEISSCVARCTAVAFLGDDVNFPHLFLSLTNRTRLYLHRYSGEKNTKLRFWEIIGREGEKIKIINLVGWIGTSARAAAQLHAFQMMRS